MTKTLEVSAPRKGKRSIQQQADHARKQMEKMNADEQQRKKAYREERENLRAELAEVESRARYVQRQEETKELKRACYLMGELAVANMQASGKLAAVVTNAAFLAMKVEYRDLIQRVLNRENLKAAAHNDRLTAAADHGIPALPDISI